MAAPFAFTQMIWRSKGSSTPTLNTAEATTMGSRQGYDVVVDVDAEGDLGHTDLNDDLEFHNSSKLHVTIPPASTRLT